MILIKNVFKVFAVIIILLSSANVFSADIISKTTIHDATNDAVGSSGNEWKYEVNKMDVQWVDDVVTVDIYTNFVDYNGRYGTGYRYVDGDKVSNGKIVFGDLLMSTDGGDTPFNYAFVLPENVRKYNDYDSHSNWGGKGALTEIDSTLTAKEYHHDSNSVQNGEVLAGNQVGDSIEGNWSIFRQNTGSNHDRFDRISFSFNVNGIDAFQNAAQLAFSWGMSCANDMVHGVVNTNRPVIIPVPEPATLLLMFLAFAFMVKTRGKKVDSFSA